MRRKRKTSPEAEIRAKAKQIMAEREAEAYKAAALMIVSRKLDEIRDLLQGVGYTAANQPVGLVRNLQTNTQAAVPGVGGPQAPIQHACTYCGAESVYRTKPNRYNRTGTWLCRVHVGLRKQHEQVGTAQPQVMNPEGQAVVVNGGAPLAPEKVDTGVDVGVADAFAALGVS